MRLVERPMTRKAVLFSMLLLSAVLAPAPGRAQNPISFTVTNRSFDNIRVIIYDDVCHRRLYEGVIGGNAAITLNSCAHNRRYGNIRIWNQATGITRRYSGLMRGARIRLP
jgi:hypothetical protein